MTRFASDVSHAAGPTSLSQTLDDPPPSFLQQGEPLPGIHDLSLEALAKQFCFNIHRSTLWHGLISFLSVAALTRKFRYAYLGGGFTSLKERPHDIDVILETDQPYGAEALASISRFFTYGLPRIEELYGVDLHFWMRDAPDGFSDFRAFFQYTKPAGDHPAINLARGIFRIDLQAQNILSLLRRQMGEPGPSIGSGEEILPDLAPRDRGAQRLVAAVQTLSVARDLESIIDIVRKEARLLFHADGATFVLRDGDCCHYVDEDAISPLWKGQRFAMSTCISGWVMEHRQAAAITDIQKDDRIPLASYRPTFVKSLIMVPIRSQDPIGAVGIYWAQIHDASQEVELAQALANCAAIAMENVELRKKLEFRVQEYQLLLENANRELRSFSHGVSDDFRRSLATVV